MYLSVFKADSAIFSSSGIVITGKILPTGKLKQQNLLPLDVCEKLKILLKKNLTYLKLTEFFYIIKEFLWLENVTTNRDIRPVGRGV